jgi:HSP20 family molecular chaperone IbpA
MNYDYSQRGYLLPKGCKDLMDVTNQKAPTPSDFKFAVTERSLLIIAQVPVLCCGDLEIAVDGNVLRVNGKRSGSDVPFECVVEVPSGYHATEGKAAYFNGQLCIIMPKL